MTRSVEQLGPLRSGSPRTSDRARSRVLRSEAWASWPRQPMPSEQTQERSPAGRRSRIWPSTREARGHRTGVRGRRSTGPQEFPLAAPAEARMTLLASCRRERRFVLVQTTLAIGCRVAVSLSPGMLQSSRSQSRTFGGTRGDVGDVTSSTRSRSVMPVPAGSVPDANRVGVCAPRSPPQPHRSEEPAWRRSGSAWTRPLGHRAAVWADEYAASPEIF